MIRNIHMYFYDLFRMYMNFLGFNSDELEEAPEARLLHKYAMDSIARSDISTIRSEDIHALIKCAEKVSEKDAQRLQKLLRNIFDYGVAIALLDESPCIGAATPRGKRPLRNNDIYVFTDEEIDRLLDAFSQCYLQNAFLLILFCGLTAGEIIRLRISDYDAGEHTLTLTDPRGGRRSIYLAPVQEKVVQQEIKRQQKMAQIRERPDKPATFLFGDYKGDMLPQARLQKATCLIRQNSQVLQFSLRRLRQYFIIQSIREGDNPGDVIYYAGMSSRSGIQYLYTATASKCIASTLSQETVPTSQNSTSSNKEQPICQTI